MLSIHVNVIHVKWEQETSSDPSEAPSEGL